MTSGHDFEAVLVAARDGEEWALAELYRAIYPRIVRYVLIVLGLLVGPGGVSIFD